MKPFLLQTLSFMPQTLPFLMINPYALSQTLPVILINPAPSQTLSMFVISPPQSFFHPYKPDPALNHVLHLD
jgi:hypothetical protein